MAVVVVVVLMVVLWARRRLERGVCEQTSTHLGAECLVNNANAGGAGGIQLARPSSPRRAGRQQPAAAQRPAHPHCGWEAARARFLRSRGSSRPEITMGGRSS